MTPQDARGAGYHLIHRETGVVEVTCPAGVGHPSLLLTEAFYPGRWRAWMGVHGCSGGCARAGWRMAERAFLHEQEHEQEQERGGEGEPRRPKGCDHKFVDSTACLKCGWRP